MAAWDGFILAQPRRKMAQPWSKIYNNRDVCSWIQPGANLQVAFHYTSKNCYHNEFINVDKINGSARNQRDLSDGLSEYLFHFVSSCWGVGGWGGLLFRHQEDYMNSFFNLVCWKYQWRMIWPILALFPPSFFPRPQTKGIGSLSEARPLTLCLSLHMAPDEQWISKRWHENGKSLFRQPGECLSKC